MSHHLGLGSEAHVVSYKLITFRVRTFYCEQTLEEALQTIVDRGADYFDDKDDPSIFEVRIPAEFDPEPYVATLEMATDAITDVELQPGLRTVICA